MPNQDPTPKSQEHDHEASAPAKQAVECEKEIFKNISPELAAHFIEPNVVLTLAGERGQTEFFIDTTSSQTIEDLQSLNQTLASHGVRLQPSFQETARGKCTVVNVESIKGYERASKMTDLPGVAPFEASSGWEGLDQWIESTHASVKAEQAQGRIPVSVDPIHYITGVIKGYPDKAILSALSTDTMPLVDSDIAHASEYECAQPNYQLSEELVNDPDIVAHQRRWGQILGTFYDSAWHRNLAKDREFIMAREAIDIQ